MRGIVQCCNCTFEMYDVVDRAKWFDGMVPRCLEVFGVKKIGELNCRPLLPTYIISTDQSIYHVGILFYSSYRKLLGPRRNDEYVYCYSILITILPVCFPE
jgi:hypothetical protein